MILCDFSKSYNPTLTNFEKAANIIDAFFDHICLVCVIFVCMMPKTFIL